MESLTKNRQGPEALRAMIERAYGPAEVPGPGADWVTELGDGWFSVVYRIRLRSGRRVVLKIAPPAGVEVLTYERGAMATELAALRLIRERTGVPVPEVDFADRSHELCDADWFFMTYVDAENFGVVRETLAPAARDACHEAIGAVNRELNSIRGTAFGPLAGPGESTWRATFTRMAGDVLGDGERRGIDLGYGYDEIRAVLAAHADSLDEVTEPRFVEWDMWDKNVLVRDGAIVAVVDHERAFWGDPLIESGFTASELPGFGDATAFIRGYGHEPFTGAQRTRRRLYNLYLTLIMTIETDYRGHTDPAPYDWAREQLAEAMSRLLPAG